MLKQHDAFSLLGHIINDNYWLNLRLCPGGEGWWSTLTLTNMPWEMGISKCALVDGSWEMDLEKWALRYGQHARYKFLPSGLCAEKCCNRGKKGLSGRIGTFSGPILEQIGTFCRYLHQNAELLKIMRKHDNPISRPEKVHWKTKSLSSKYTHF